MKRVAIFLLVCLFFLHFSYDSISAQNTIFDPPFESVNPSDGMSYLYKRIKEKVSMFFAFSNKNKIDNYKNLLNTRLAELKFVIENKHMSYFEKSTQRYFTTAGELTSLLKSADKAEVESVKELLASHIPILTKLRDTFEFGTAEWRFVEDDINYIKGYSNDLSPM